MWISLIFVSVKIYINVELIVQNVLTKNKMLPRLSACYFCRFSVWEWTYFSSALNKDSFVIMVHKILKKLTKMWYCGAFTYLCFRVKERDFSDFGCKWESLGSFKLHKLNKAYQMLRTENGWKTAWNCSWSIKAIFCFQNNIQVMFIFQNVCHQITNVEYFDKWKWPASACNT